ncbi:MAG: SRPBCC family protein [Candidatus Kapabacteria bacterium]|nr:SRPBCC family protein [Candidatus Kapabacteria bacterium]
MKFHKLHKKQFLPIDINLAWEFFSSPLNLSKITPSYMDFRITSDLPEEMYEGMIITYKVKPVAGIPVNWVTEISHIRKPYFFIDTQLSGPYKLWHHQHIFKEVDNGIEMEDIVHYKLPFGILGNIANFLFVSKQLEGIFNYRKKVLSEIFKGG